MQLQREALKIVTGPSPRVLGTIRYGQVMDQALSEFDQSQDRRDPRAGTFWVVNGRLVQVVQAVDKRCFARHPYGQDRDTGVKGILALAGCHASTVGSARSRALHLSGLPIFVLRQCDSATDWR